MPSETVLDRTPDRTGHFTWTNKVAAGGLDLVAVANALLASAEFTALWGTTTNTEFVTQLHEFALDRTPDVAGLAAWVAALDSDALSRTDLVVRFSESLEMQSKSEAPSLMFTRAGYQQDFTDDAFRAVVATQGDLADADATVSLTADLAHGTALRAVIGGLMETPESQAIYNGTTNIEFVELLYQNVLGRVAEAAGLASWTSKLDAGVLTRADVTLGIAQSREAVAKLADDLVDHMRAIGVDDTLDGDAGNDVQFGGILADDFLFNPADPGTDRIAGLEAWDTLRFEGFGYASDADALAKMTQVGDDVMFSDRASQQSSWTRPWRTLPPSGSWPPENAETATRAAHFGRSSCFEVVSPLPYGFRPKEAGPFLPVPTRLPGVSERIEAGESTSNTSAGR